MAPGFFNQEQVTVAASQHAEQYDSPEFKFLPGLRMHREHSLVEYKS